MRSAPTAWASASRATGLAPTPLTNGCTSEACRRSDTATPLWMGQEMEKQIKGSALIVLEDAGHFAYLDKCDRFLRIMDAFLFPKEG